MRKLAGLIVAAVVAMPAWANADGKFVGVDKCKTCHNAKAKGEQEKKWMTTAHAKAFEDLASDAAKKLNGGQSAQANDKCLKCHVTGAGKGADAFAASFKKEKGVQCEACHGPGEAHVKARMKGDDSKVAAGEVVKKPTEAVCTGCHNKESPNFKEFKFAEAFKKIEHPMPKK